MARWSDEKLRKEVDAITSLVDKGYHAAGIVEPIIALVDAFARGAEAAATEGLEQRIRELEEELRERDDDIRTACVALRIYSAGSGNFVPDPHEMLAAVREAQRKEGRDD